VVFLRSLAPVHSDLPPPKVPFLIARLVQAVPRPVTEPVPPLDLSTPARRGAYLVEVGHCTGCHTPIGPPPRFQPIAGMEMAGGSRMAEGVSAANLTPDASGIVYYDEALFVQAIRTGCVGARKLKHMPWWTFRNMTDEDLKAVFAYLRTLKAGAPPSGQHGATHSMQTLPAETRTGRSELRSYSSGAAPCAA
jgi:mono/diheme cytochrome c family protein